MSSGASRAPSPSGLLELEPATASFPNVRPKDAATLIVLRRDPDRIRVLMGRRSDQHRFMPGAVVFPGGKVDRADSRGPAADDLHPAVAAKLALSTRNPDPRRARVIALAAIREAYEEAGILIGKKMAAGRASSSPAWAPFLQRGILPSLAPLRFVARAITPPGRFRHRFDARFFAVFADAIAAEVEVPGDELGHPAWLSFDEARAHALSRPTRFVLDSLEPRLQQDPDLAPDGPAPFLVTRRGKACIEVL
jgi:8-oxo-dGTP pyrophosphatase MutT (NUDIX family)